MIKNINPISCKNYILFRYIATQRIFWLEQINTVGMAVTLNMVFLDYIPSTTYVYKHCHKEGIKEGRRKRTERKKEERL